MSTAEAVVVCALSLLGRSPHQLPPIGFLDVPPPYVSPNAEAFVDRQSNTMYLITTAPAFREARSRRPVRLCTARAALIKIASVIVHEEWHIRNGPDERGAYEAQLTALATLGAGVGSPIYADVKRAMMTVLRTKSPRRTIGRRRKTRLMPAGRSARQ